MNMIVSIWLFGLSVLVAFVLAVACQQIYDTYCNSREQRLSEIILCTSDDEFVYGDTVYDSVYGCTAIVIGTHLGEDNDLYTVVVRVSGNTIYIYKSLPSALTKIAEQE